MTTLAVSFRPPDASVTAIALGFAAVLVGCTAAPDSRTTTTASADTSLPQVLATIGEESITLAEVQARLGGRLDQLSLRYQMDRHRYIQAGLDAMLRERVLEAEAQRQDKTVDQLITAEAGGTLEPSEVEIAFWYQENQDRLGGRTFDDVRSQIGAMLRSQRHDSAGRALFARLSRERQVKVLLEPFRVPLHNEGAPNKGPEMAPVELTEFSDFQCPFCAQVVPTLKRVEQTYGDRVRIVYRQFPIPNLHPLALKAAEASLCAHEQGRFWAMHDLMFAEQDRLDPRSLKMKAARLGLNQRKFDNCLDSGQYAERVQQDADEGDAVGVTGTPALFLNGMPLEGGALPYERLVEAIEKELARAR